jgi:hypothetical protein
MRTPAGIECPYFYGDYYRGKKNEECRLLGKQPAPQNWTPDLCTTCPVPSIKRANACEYMELTLVIKRRLGIFKRYIQVSAYCHKAKDVVKEPHVGCGICHPLDFTKIN